MLTRSRLAPAALGLLLLLGCGPKPGGSGEPAARPPAAPEKKPPTTPKGPAKAPPRGSSEYRRVLFAYVNGKIPASPAEAEGLEAADGWNTAGWEDPAECKKFTDRGRTLMYVASRGGAKGKSAVMLTKELCLAPKGALRVAVYNLGPGAVKVAAAFQVSERWIYYESQPQEVPAGAWGQLAFDLAATTYKTESSKWQHTAGLWRREDTKQLALLIYSGGKPFRVLIDGLSADQAPRPKRPPPPPEKREKPAKEKPGEEKPEKEKPAKEGPEKEPEKKDKALIEA